MPEEIDMVCKDMFTLCTRLFDHRAVVRAGCKYLVRELETKRNKDNVKTIHEILSASEKTKTLIPECVELLNERVEKVHTLVVNAASKGLDVLSEQNMHEDIIREKYKKKREEEWEIFRAEMNKAQNDILKKHEERMKELENKDFSN